MRVLVLSNLYPPNAMGGYELSCRDVVDRWRAKGHAVSVLTTAGSVGGVVEPAAAEPHVSRELEWYWSEHAFLRPAPRQRLALERHNQKRLRAALRDTRPDVVSVWHMGGMSLSLLGAIERADIPVVLSVCDEWPAYAPAVDAWTDSWSRRRPWQRRLGAWLSGVPTDLPELDRHGIAFVSVFTRERLKQRTRWRFPRQTVVGSGVDPVDFPVPPAQVPRPWGWRLLGVGRIEPRKGFDAAVRALPDLPGARLRLVGVPDPQHLRELMRIADDSGVLDRLQVEAVPRGQLRQVYRDADVVLFPSRWEEPFGLVPLEAMTQRTPVVATRRGGSAEFLVDDVNCLEVPPDDPTALAVAVRRLAGDPALRSRLTDSGVQTAEGYTVDRLADVLEGVHLAEVARHAERS